MDCCSLRSEASALSGRKALPTLSNPNTNESSTPAIPTAAQLAETRLKQWHQQGEALLTMENLRAWINAAGLVLFAPRPQIASPAPSLVEAVLGASNPSPTIEQTGEARGLLARLVAEGLAVPLNLLGPGVGTVHAGAPGDTPDFVASTAVFPYVFTLRGDKAWKQAPVTSGAFKVSNLASAIHAALAERGPLTAYDLTTEVGKEVTEAAVLRALAELWTHLRVLPLYQPGGASTVWELTSARFTKQIKAGANAGQPSALSALISLYLGQAVVASEDEIESFLSPLASRSRVRDVIHALLSARQLNAIAIEGRTMLHVAGALPAFLAPQVATPSPESEVSSQDAIAVEAGAGEVQPRITRFVAKPRKIGTGYLAKAKPARSGDKPFSAAKSRPYDRGIKPRTSTGPKRDFGSGPKPREGFGPTSGKARRPFTKPASPGFDKPWNEEKARRAPASRRPSEVHAKEGQGAEGQLPRKTFSKPGTFGRKREGFAGGAPRGDFGKRASQRPDQGKDQRPGRGFDRGERGGFGSARSPGSYAAKPRGERPAGDRPQRRDAGDRGPGKPFGSRPTTGSKFAAKARFFPSDKAGGKPRSESKESGKPAYRKFDAPRDRPSRSFSSDRPARPEGSANDAQKRSGDFAKRKFTGKPSGKASGFAGKTGRKPGGGFAGKRSSAKPGTSFSGNPASTFAKFAGNKKPFGKRPPGRKFKPSQGDSA